MIEVLEVDQWTSTGDVKSHDWDALKSQGIEAVNGGDSAAARVIFGGHFWFREVDPQYERPFIGRVWFRKGADGKPELWLTNYDSSD
mgnify:FL=1